ncbi:hypothetical protein SAMN05661080_02831 [Modestobacter sp. DSM 44400]|uniref:methylase n=1 Tax=Modestobacter sp. DSM 44400 TaxID=1550230 RepID=UPI00089752A8|nr:methylase [Modestobacter sp. DSM 44400]SDY25022.1 hypothetical protein SAMN05661080_02831 [Modestobacter sp. DSM 44400]
MDYRGTSVAAPSRPAPELDTVGAFDCAEESAHYAFSVQLLLSQYAAVVPWRAEGVGELGSGDARAVGQVVRTMPGLRVHGTDISATSVERARATIDELGVADRYTVELGDFFEWAGSAAGRRISTVIANPPYIPAPDGDILMPELWGGVHGNDLALRLLTVGFEHLLVALPSYSDPAEMLETAADLGYRVANFLAMGLEFGRYSNEPKVRAHIERLVAEGHGWAGDDEYVVAIALLTQSPAVARDRSAQLRRALQLPG